ncbi:hypothetical protein EJB05_00385, partial [Eragrostis curvula]
MFLVTLGQGWSKSAVWGTIKHSTETISRKFDEVLNCVVAMCKNYIRPIDPNFTTTHSRITNDHRMMPHFKNCIGAIDDIRSIFLLKMRRTHQLQNQVTTPWIGSVMT